ncbi:hypothetical protein ACJD0Z_09365 [Flavobacteriaceae bacterium M23B6Z8]
MKISTLNANRREYNRMRDRISDLSREYSFDQIVRIENLEIEKFKLKKSVAEKTYGWAMSHVLSRDEREKIIANFLRSLDLKFDSNLHDFIIGSSDDPGCCGGGGRSSEPAGSDREERMRDLEEQGRNPIYIPHPGGPGGDIYYDD